MFLCSVVVASASLLLGIYDPVNNNKNTLHMFPLLFRALRFYRPSIILIAKRPVHVIARLHTYIDFNAFSNYVYRPIALISISDALYYIKNRSPRYFHTVPSDLLTLVSGSKAKHSSCFIRFIIVRREKPKTAKDQKK